MDLKRAMTTLFIVLLLTTGISVAQRGTQPAQSSAQQQSSATQNAISPANQTPIKIGILPFTDATGSGGSDTGKALSRMVQAEFTHSKPLAQNVSRLDLLPLTRGQTVSKKERQDGRR